jgi:hypothetical protein
MGLDTSHNAWHGAYRAFMRWRMEIARIVGVPLELMEGFYYYSRMNVRILAEYDGENAESFLKLVDRNCPIKWEALKPDPLHVLLVHSDCDGQIPPEDCALIADRLEQIIPELPAGDAGGHIGNWRDKTQQFIDGCRAASAANESLDFH